MLKLRNRADAKTTPKLPLVWDDEAEETLSPSPEASSEDKQAEAKEAKLDSQQQPEHLEELKDEAEEQALTADEEADEEVEQDNESDDTSQAEDDDGGEDGNGDNEPVILHVPDDEPLGNALMQLRAKAGVTVKDVAEKTKIPAQKIHDLELGNYEELPKLIICKAYIERLCNEYDVEQESYLSKLEREYLEAVGSDSDNRQHPLSEDLIKPKSVVSLPGLLIAALLGVLCLFILGGLAKLYFKKEIERDKVDFIRLIPQTRQPVEVLPIPGSK